MATKARKKALAVRKVLVASDVTLKFRIGQLTRRLAQQLYARALASPPPEGGEGRDGAGGQNRTTIR